MNKEDRVDGPFQWGDRVDHKLFGLGVVNGEPTESMNGRGETSWAVPVKWDASDRPDSKIGHAFLSLVERPDAKGGAFWANEHKKRLAPALTQIKALEMALSESYRPKSQDASKRVRGALDAVQRSIGDLLDFIEEDEKGHHP